MSEQVLYLGDGELRGAAGYLAGIMTRSAIDFQHVASDRSFDSHLLGGNVRALILSDYPADNFTSVQLAEICRRVEDGLGLLMIGGWESYSGRGGGGYQATCLREVLPVRMSDGDDRRNCWGPCVVEKVRDHAITDDLPFDQNAPCVCGFNEIRAKDETACVLAVQRFEVTRQRGAASFAPGPRHPLLVVERHAKGKVACYASDVAPHWAGGFVDWGSSRITVQAEGGAELEVGNHYVRLFTNMVRWISKTEI